MYKNIESELNRNESEQLGYKPVMKKRVYNLSRSFNGAEEVEENPQVNKKEEEPDSILNYLINRLSEQHKSKLEPVLNEKN